MFLAVTLALLAACHPNTNNTAAGPVDNSPPVASVNGKPISRDLYEFYVKGITSGKSSADLSPQQRDKALDNLIGGRLVADEAMKDGLDKDPDTAYILQLTRLNVLEQAVEQRYLKDRKPTEQELRAEYETQLAAMPKTEYHARHILVKDEATAEQIRQLATDGQSQAGAAVFAAGAGVGLLERLEDDLLLLRRDADAGVRDLEGHHRGEPRKTG